MKTLDRLKSENKVVLDLDFRKNTLLDQSGNSNDASVSNGTPSWANTQHGRGLVQNTDERVVVADSAELQLTEGYILVFGDFKETTNGRIVSKRDGGGTNYDFYIVSSTSIAIYDGSVTRALSVSSLIGKKMIAVKFTASGIPEGFVDGINIGQFNGTSTITVNDAPLQVGNIYTGSGGASFPITKVVILNDSTISEQDIASIYDEYMQERGVLEIPRRNFVYPTPKETSANILLDLDMTTRTGDGKMADLSGNGNDGTITNVAHSKGFWNDGIAFSDNQDSLINCGSDSSLDDIAPASWEFVFKPTGAGGLNVGRLFDKVNTAIYYNGSNNLLYIQVIFSGGSVSWFTDAIVVGEWNHLIVTYDHRSTANDPVLYVNGNPVGTEAGGPPSGTYNTDAGGDACIGNRGTLGRSFDGNIALARMFSGTLSADDVAKRYAEYAKKLNFYQGMTDVPPTLADVSSGRIGLTEFERITGTISLVEDSAGTYFEIGSNETCATKSNQAYGTWVFEATKAETAFLQYTFIASENGPFDTSAAQNGYLFDILNTDGIILYRVVNGGISGAVITTSTGIIDADVKYKYALTRRYDGLFTLYIKGGAYTDWQQLGSTGTENTHTTSKYMTLGGSVDTCKYYNIITHEGVLTLAQLKELYP